MINLCIALKGGVAMVKVLRSFIALNLLLVVPLCGIVTTFLPDRLTLAVRSVSDLSLSVLSDCDGKSVRLNGATCRGSTDWQLLRVNLPEGTRRETLQLKFDGGAEKYSIADIAIVYSQFWQMRIDNFRMEDLWGRHIVNLENQKWNFSPRPEKRILIAVCGIEIAMFLLSVLTLFVKPISRQFMEDVMVALLPAFLFAVFFSLYLPVQSYLANRAMFQYGVGNVVTTMVPVFALCFFWCLMSLAIMRRWLDFIPHVLLFAIVLYEYFETGLLTIGAPALDGNFAFYYDSFRKWIDVAVVILITIVCIVLYRQMRICLKWICGGLMLLLCSAMIDTHVDEVAEGIDVRSGKCLRQQMLDSAGYSSNRNVMVFVLDCISSQLAMDVVDAEPALRDAFEGFVAYTNNVGMHAYTLIGGPSLITGCYYFDDGERNISSERRFVQEIYGKESFAWPYATNNLPVFMFSAADSPYGFTTKLNMANLSTIQDAQKNKDIMSQRVEGGLAWNLKEICAFRIVPFPVKHLAYAIFSSNWGSMEVVDSESVLYPRIAELPVRDDWPVSLHSYHTDGGHAPFLIDRYGNELSAPRNNYDGAFEKTSFALRCLATLMRKYRALDIYDDSLIIVTTDHGNEFSQTSPYRAFPMLWVKPVGRNVRMMCSPMPTSHSRIHDLVTNAFDHDLNKEDCDRILESENRLYLRVGVGDKSRAKDEYWQIDGSCNLKQLTSEKVFPKGVRLWRR